MGRVVAKVNVIVTPSIPVICVTSVLITTMTHMAILHARHATIHVKIPARTERTRGATNVRMGTLTTVKAAKIKMSVSILIFANMVNSVSIKQDITYATNVILPAMVALGLVV